MNKKAAIVIILVILTMLVSFVLPKPKYTSPDVLSQLNIPESFDSWRSRDISNEINTDGDIYNFVSRIFARQYARSIYYSLLDKDVEVLTLLILDAGNFHNPKVCYGSSGYKITELDDMELAAGSKKFEAHALSMEKGGEGLVMIYWICIDKKIVGWAGQKALELWTSLLRDKKAGLMVRLDIPARKGNPETSLRIAQEFIKDLSINLTPEQSEYLFGK